jgi:NTE family protein
MIGFVLSGGANLGSIHVGMLRALLEGGVKPDVIVGTSIGAVNAAYLASDPSVETVDQLNQLWCDVRARDIFPLSPFRNAPTLFRKGGFFSSHKWRDFITERLPYRDFDETAVPLKITATGFEDGQSVVLEKGSAVDAIMASTALPGIFPPHEIDGCCYLDGAISDQLPLKVALEAGAHTIYVMAISVPSPPLDRRSPFSILRHSLTILLFPRVRLDALDLPGDQETVRIIQVPSIQTQVSLWDMSRHQELIDTAYETTKEFLEHEHDDDEQIDVASVPEMEIETQTPEEPVVEA